MTTGSKDEVKSAWTHHGWETLILILLSKSKGSAAVKENKDPTFSRDLTCCKCDEEKMVRPGKIFPSSPDSRKFIGKEDLLGSFFSKHLVKVGIGE